MTDVYYPLPRGQPFDEARELVIPRAKALFDAIRRHRDFEIVGLSRLLQTDGLATECLIVDVTCDGVPSRNSYGLQYRERLVLHISPDSRTVPTVYALRKGFPRLVHQHQTAMGSPAHLCLYFESPTTVLRTWTPENFLHRIQWWIEQSARGALHPADQPLDHLFFTSKFELILPWNFDVLRETSQEFILVRGEQRSDGGITSFLLPKVAASDPKPRTTILVDLVLPPVVAGAVELHPATLGELADVLDVRGIALLPALIPKLRELVSPQGTPVTKGRSFTVVLLHVPLCREPGAEPEAMSHRAFVLLDDALELGTAIGALMVLDGKAYTSAGLLQRTESTDWRNHLITPMDVLSENTPESARRQSGLSEPGPAGVVVGAGALGSAMLNLWGRSGWGRWTVIDKDHIRPHNLSRHTAVASHMGEPKCQAVAGLHQAAMHGASEIVPIVADACEPHNEQVATLLRGTQLVVDVSASLDYPRYASTIDGYARHASVFVTPSANAGVALVEDVGRSQRLRTLEAQYYRAMIQNDWGREHLAGTGTFWSGASCRDISMVMPYARVMAHASTFVEQLPRLVADDNATIQIWERDDAAGGLAVHDVSVESERRLRLTDDLDVFMDAGLERELREFRQHGFPNETGGILLGYYDFNVNALVLVAALPAPPDSKGTPGSFERGVDGLKEKVDDVTRRTAGNVGYVGEWHSHPLGHSATPSRDDWFQLIYLALGMGDDGLPGVQLIIGEHDLQVLKGSMHV